jgi:acetylornithine deacetylase
VINTHVDVVPPSEGMADGWTGRMDEAGVVHGRGACDAKGQVATFWLVLRALESLGAKLRGDLIGHLVTEEENGGNGTLALVRRGEQADAAVVMEPSDGKLYTSVRGAVWFRLTLKGKAGHGGQAGQTRSALLMARDAIGILECYHADLLAKSRGFPLFDPYPNPMPLAFGRLQSGNWPASAPSRAVLEGMLGLLPNTTKEQVCEEIGQALRSQGDEFLAKNFDLHFMYRHDCSVVDPNHELPQAFQAAAHGAAVPLEISGMTASCDAWFYTNRLKIPCVVYGPGSLKVAHSRDEQISMGDIGRAAEVLVRLVLDYCGASP